MEDITTQNLGNILKKVRKEKGFTQKEVAEGIHVDQSIISGWERGTYNPTFLNVYKVCQFLDMTVDELLGIAKKRRITITTTQEEIEKLSAAIGEFEEALEFVFPSQETKLHQKWSKVKRIMDLFLF